VDGVLCGHIHTASVREIDGTAYYNCGDWVESCTAMVEHFDGRMELLHFDQSVEPVKNSQRESLQDQETTALTA
jgi:predicted phosphodiesterase